MKNRAFSESFSEDQQATFSEEALDETSQDPVKSDAFDPPGESSSNTGASVESTNAANGASSGTTVDSLEVGEIYEGKVVRIMNYGAFVDIGSERDVLVHISEFTTQYVYSVEDYVEVGQDVVLRLLDIEDGRLKGTFITDQSVRANRGENRRSQRQSQRTQERKWQDVSAFVDISSEDELTGVVTKLARNGAFIKVPDVSDEGEGWLHNGQMGCDFYVQHSADVLSEGQEIRVKVMRAQQEEGLLYFTMNELLEN
ncbi:MAG: S1 RNA-binding domain-containing protein [Bacteroidota bacterium]